jgi:hypothetical protein
MSITAACLEYDAGYAFIVEHDTPRLARNPVAAVVKYIGAPEAEIIAVNVVGSDILK